MKPDDLRSWLETERQKCANELATALREQASAETLQTLRSRLSLVNEAHGQLRESWQKRLRVLGAVALAVLITVTLLAVAEIPHTAVSIDVIAHAISFDTGQRGGMLSNLEARGPVAVRGRTFVESPLFDIGSEDTVDDVRIDSGNTLLDNLVLPPNQWVDIARQEDELVLVIQVTDEPTVATFEFTGALDATMRRGDGSVLAHQETIHVPETVIFTRKGEQTAGTSNLELVLNRFSGADSLGDLYPVELRFVDRQTTGVTGSPFVGSLVSGTVLFPEIGRTHALQSDDALLMQGLDIDRLRIEVNEQIHVQMTGRAHSVVLRTGSFQQSLAPSWLEYFAKSHALKFLWGAGAFLWGLAWGFRRLLN